MDNISEPCQFDVGVCLQLSLYLTLSDHFLYAYARLLSSSNVKKLCVHGMVSRRSNKLLYAVSALQCILLSIFWQEYYLLYFVLLCRCFTDIFRPRGVGRALWDSE